jgi:hypothetical protein
VGHASECLRLFAIAGCFCRGFRQCQTCIFFSTVDNCNVSNRETVIEFVRNLPEEMSLAEIAREIELLAGIQTAREEARRRQGIPAEDARKIVDAWVSK